MGSDSRSSSKPQKRLQLDQTNHWLQPDFGPVAWKSRQQWSSCLFILENKKPAENWLQLVQTATGHFEEYTPL